MTKARSNATANAAKGDLTVGNGTNLSGVLAVGSNGDTIVADSSTATGLRYQSAYNGNGVINGGMDIWQRGTSFALVSPGTAYTADRWLGRHLGTNVTYSQQTSGLAGFQYSLRIQRPNGTTGTNDQQIYYQFETPDSYRYASQTVTLSFYAKAGANYTTGGGGLFSGLYSGTGTNQNITSGAYTGQVTVVSAQNTLTTSWQRFSITGTVGSTASQIAVIFSSTPTGTAGANDWYEITGVQLEFGSVATSFKRSAGGSIQGELAACQRYYQRVTAGTVYGTVAPIAWQGSATVTYTTVPLPVTMRTAPTSLDSGNIAFLSFARNTVFTLSSVTLDVTNSTQNVVASATISGGTTGTGGSWTGNNNSAGYLGFSAEL